MHTYTEIEVTELTTLANEAQELEQQWTAILQKTSDFIRAYTNKNDDYLCWNINYPELQGIATIVQSNIDVPNYKKLPQVGQMAYKNIQRASEWAKMNNRVRKAIAKLEKELAKIS